MLAVLDGLSMLKDRCEVKVYTPDALLVNMVRQGKMEKWRREEWRRPQDKELRNQELWQQLWEQTQKHTLTFVYVKHSKYSAELTEKMRQ